MIKKNGLIVRVGLSFLILLVISVVAVKACELTIDAIDFGSGTTVSNLKVLSWASSPLKITTRNGIVTSEVLTDGVYHFKAGRKGYKTSIHPVEIVCSDGKAHATLKLLAGEKSEEIYVLPDRDRIDSSGIAVFAKDLNLIGKNWWKPLSPRACSSDCEVSFSVEIDEFGNVTSATPLTGAASYRNVAEKALKTWEFYPVYHEGRVLRAKGMTQILFK